MNLFDYSDLTIDELEKLSSKILTLIEEKKRTRFTDEYISELENVLIQFEEWLVLKLGAKNINIFSDRTQISIDFKINKYVFILFKEKLGKWYLNNLIITSDVCFNTVKFESKQFGLMMMKNDISKEILEQRIYSTLPELEQGLRDIIRDFVK